MEHEDEVESTPPWLRLTASDGVDFCFYNKAEAQAYFLGEAEKWAWVPTLRAPDSNPLEALRARFRKLYEQRSHILSSNGSEAHVREAITYYLNLVPAVHDRNPLQQNILEIRDRNQAEAGWTLMWYCISSPSELGSQLYSIQQQDFNFLAGLSNATELKLRLTAPYNLHSKPARKATREINEFRNNAAQAIKAIQDDKQNASNLLRDAKGDCVAATAELNAAIEALAVATKTTIEENRINLEAKWNALTQTYDNQLALQAPSKYWRLKKNQHKLLSKAFAWATVIFGIVGAALLTLAFTLIFRNTAINQLPSWSQVLSATIAAVLFLWVVKTLVRLTMSHVHLALDAEERTTMILSYLALSKLGDTSPEERKGLFAAIFRPTGDGIVKDETPPLPIFELFKGRTP